MLTKHYTQSSLLIQWAYLFEEVRPLQTSMCALFWRATVLTPLKILGPVFAIGVILYGLVFVPLADWLAPEWTHTAGLRSVRHKHDAQTDWTVLLWGLRIIGVAVAVGVVGHVSGLWSFLHSLCIPVEIEGGLVQKGICPAPTCTGRMVVESDNSWRCRRCHGRFFPAMRASTEQ